MADRGGRGGRGFRGGGGGDRGRGGGDRGRGGRGPPPGRGAGPPRRGGQPGGRGYGDGGGRGRGGRGGPGRGRGQDFDQPAALAPDRQVSMGTAARPGQFVDAQSVEESQRQQEAAYARIPDFAKQIGKQRHAKRPDFGTAGRPVKLKANHFKVACTLREAFHYDVDIIPVRRARPGAEGGESEAAPRVPTAAAGRPMSLALCRNVVRALADQERWPNVWVFDGRKNIYTALRFLPQHEQTYEVEALDGDSPRPRPFRITIKGVATVDIKALLYFVQGRDGDEIPQDAVQALDVALKHTVSYRNEVKTFARAIFWRDPTSARSLGGGAEVWLGYNQSLRPTLAGLTVNIDLAATGFLEAQPVSQYILFNVGMRDIHDFGRMNPVQKRKADKAINGIRVEVRMNGSIRRHKAKGLTAEGADRAMFHFDKEDRDISVAEYYRIAYNIRLQHPESPCVNVGTPHKPVWLPMELCWIVPGQRVRKLDERQTAEMIKTAAQKPQDRMAYIDRCMREYADLPNDPAMQAFQMTVETKMIDVPGRHLRPPRLQYYGNQAMDPDPEKGAWNIQGVKFCSPGTITSFGVVCFVDKRRADGPVQDPASLQNFMRDMLTGCIKAGIRLPQLSGIPEQIIVWHDFRSSFPGESVHAAHDAAQAYFKTRPDIIFVVLPDRGATEAYRDVKKASDSFLGVPTQCFNPKKGSIGEQPRKSRAQYCGNVALKVNAKINGVNVKLVSQPAPVMKKPFMVLGADVTHPVGFNPSSPSVAAVVGSMDAAVSQYAVQIKPQGHRVEMITELNESVQKLLREFYKSTKKKPEAIIMYRDGVSEGQFQKVKEFEVAQIAAAIAALEGSETSSIKVTYIVIQKRHHTRLFPAVPKDGDRNGNVLPGTVVDRGIATQNIWDFFLNSHASIQGTSRPAHYTTLYDQNNFTADQLQNFTYHLTYTFCRCARSVSVVPAAYYAHLAAFRGRLMLGEGASDTESSTSGASGIGRIEWAQIHQNLLGRMFYV